MTPLRTSRLTSSTARTSVLNRLLKLTTDAAGGSSPGLAEVAGDFNSADVMLRNGPQRQ